MYTIIKQYLNRSAEFFRTRKLFTAGFTLIEVMVSVSIFTLVVGIGIGSLMTTVAANRRLQAERQTMDSLSFSLESMSRRIRTGTDFSGTPSELHFVDQEGNPVIYLLDGAGTRLVISDPASGTSDDQFLTPPNVTMNDFHIELTGNTPGDRTKLFVRVSLVGTMRLQNQESRFALETGIEPRVLDVDAL